MPKPIKHTVPSKVKSGKEKGRLYGYPVNYGTSSHTSERRANVANSAKGRRRTK